MAELASDILMIVAGKKGRLQAEGTTDFAQRASKDLSSDFFAPIFELRKFDFSVGTNASLTHGKKEGEAAEGAAPGSVKPAAAPKAKDPRADIVDIQPVGFTRLFDAASTQLFSALVNCETIPSISIIKRKAAGTKNSGEAYLRFDFKEVLMITLDWKESSDLVEETGTFIYRKLKVSYRPQKADGSLGSINQIDWTMKGPPP